MITLSSYSSKIAEEILAKMAETVAKEVTHDLFSRFATELTNTVVEGFSSWWNNNFNYAQPVYQAVQQIPSTNGNRPLEKIPFSEFYRRVTTEHQQRQQYQQYLYYMVARVTNLWMRLSPQERYKIMVDSGYYPGSYYNYDQIVANLFTNLLQMSTYR